MGRIAPADYRDARDDAAERSAALPVRRRRLRLLAGRLPASATSTSRATCCTSCRWPSALGMTSDADVDRDARSTSSSASCKRAAPRRCSGCPPGARRPRLQRQGADRVRPQSGLEHHAAARGMVDRLPIFALSYLADAMAASPAAAPRYDDVVRRLTNARARRRRSRARRGARLRRARAGSGIRTCGRRRSCSTASCGAATTRSSCRAWCAGCSLARAERPLAQHAGERDRARGAGRATTRSSKRRRRT